MTLASEFVHEPDSAEIAAALSATEANVCKHGRSPCYVFCGVERKPGAKTFKARRRLWSPITPEERWRWFGCVFGLLFADRDRAATLCVGCDANPCRCELRRRCDYRGVNGRCGAQATFWCVDELALRCQDHAMASLATSASTPQHNCNRRDCPLCNHGSLGRERGYDPTPYYAVIANEWAPSCPGTMP